MAAPTSEEIIAFGKLILPFERNTRGKSIDKDLKPAHTINTLESGIGDKIHDAENDGIPPHPHHVTYVTPEIISEIERYNIEKTQKKKYCYLWVLDKDGIKILWEDVENTLDIEDGEVKHTNITSAGFAFHGGELFFTQDNKIFINNKSDRYGDSEKNNWNAAIAYFKKTYDEYEIIDLNTYEI